MSTAHSHFSKEEIEDAKRVDLLTYLQACEPHELRRVGNEYRTVTHDSLVISNGYWHWKSQNIGGKNALKYLETVCGMSFMQAVETLLSVPSVIKTNLPPLPKKSPRPSLVLPQAIKYPNKVLSYLQDRGIAYDIIKECLNRKILYQSEKHSNCVFVGYDKSGKERFTSLRGTRGSFKQDLTGSDKRFGFSLSGTGDTLVVCESAIDALSRATLDKLDGVLWKERHYLSLGGTSPLALNQYLSDHPNIRVVFLCLDNDRAGEQGMVAAQKVIRASHEGESIKISALSPPPDRGKDWNECLKSIKAERLSARREAGER